MTSHIHPSPHRRSLRRLVALSAAAIAVTASLSACSSAGSASGTTTLEFQTAQSADSPLLAALTTVTKEFEQQHPDIKVDLRTGGNDYESQIKVRLAANNPPDLWATHGWSRDRYSSFLAPLQDQSWAKHFNKALDPAMKNDDGEFFALPVDTAVSGLIVNETVLQKAGVSADSITDWDAFMAASAKVADSGATPLTLAGSKDGSAGNVVDWLAPGAFTKTQLASFTDGTFPKSAYQKVLDVLDQFRTEGLDQRGLLLGDRRRHGEGPGGEPRRVRPEQQLPGGPGTAVRPRREAPVHPGAGDERRRLLPDRR